MSRLLLVIALAAASTGCALAAGIFRAGFWTGVILAVVLVLIALKVFRPRR